MTLQEAYLKMHKECKLKVGDIVKIVKKFESNELGCGLYYAEDMKEYIGTIGKIIEKTISEYVVEFEDIYYYYPFFVLDKVADGGSKIDEFIDSIDFDCDNPKQAVKQVANKILEMKEEKKKVDVNKIIDDYLKEIMESLGNTPNYSALKNILNKIIKEL